MGPNPNTMKKGERNVVRRHGFFPASEAPDNEDVNEIEKGIGSGECRVRNRLSKTKSNA